MSIRVGHILRHEDDSGVSGTGVVAEWIEYSDGEVVVHWLSHTPSTNHYRNIKQLESIHGHGGKTEMVVIWEQPHLTVEEDLTVEDVSEKLEKEKDLENLEEEDPSKSPKKSSKKKAPVKKKPE